MEQITIGVKGSKPAKRNLVTTLDDGQKVSIKYYRRFLFNGSYAGGDYAVEVGDGYVEPMQLRKGIGWIHNGEVYETMKEAVAAIMEYHR